MHIILTIDYSPWSSYSGGAQYATHHLAQALVRRDHKVTVIYTKPPWENVRVPDDVLYNIKWGTLLSARSKRNAFFRPLSAISVNNIIKKIFINGEPTVVHSNGEEGGLVHLLRKKYRMGFISTPHHPHYPEIFFKYDKIPFTQNIRLAITNGKYLMQQSAATNADFCTPPSKWAADLVKKAYKIDDKRLNPIPNGVSDLFLNYQRNKNASKGPAIFFGRLTHTKGIDVLIKSLSLLGNDAPDFLIVGRGDLEDWVNQEIDKYHLRSKIKMLPWVNHVQLAKLLCGASMAVLPSREENFSLAILEAMVTGTPTISTSVGGTPEIITHLENGYLVEPEDPVQLKNAIQFLRQNVSDAESLGKNASSHIRKELTWDKAGERFEKIYLQSLGIN